MVFVLRPSFYGFAGLVTIGTLIAAICLTVARHTPESLPQASPIIMASSTTVATACDGINFSHHTRGGVQMGELVVEQQPGTVLYIDGNLDMSARIVLEGSHSCLYVNGSIGPSAAISLRGDNSGIVITGSINPSAVVELTGRRGVMSLPSFEFGLESPGISANNPGGGSLFVKSGRQVYA